MTPAGERLQRECAVLTAYLVGEPPTPYVLRKYAEGHGVLTDLAAATTFEAVTLRVVRSRPLLTRLVDAHASVFASAGLLRRKLTLLAAILESSPGFYRMMERVEPIGRPALLLDLSMRLATSLLALVVGSIFLVPLQGLLLVTDRTRRAWQP